MRQTSINSYHASVEQGTVETQCDQIMMILRFSDPLSQRDIAKRLGLPPGRISARFSKLQKENKVKKAGKKYDHQTNRWVLVWEAVN